MVSDIEKVKEIARQTRKWAMKHRSNTNEDEADYWDNSFPNDLAGMCAIAAAELWRRLTKEGIEAKLAIRNAGGDSHCFVIVDDFVVDVTATQFGMKAVEVVHKKAAREYSFWCHTKLHDTDKQLKTYQAKTGWPFSQLAKV